MNYDPSVQVSWIQHRDLRIPMTYDLSVQIDVFDSAG
jgi:hypothetical protein